MITDLKDLQKLFKLCRAQGITDLKISGIEVKFGELPQTKRELAYQEMDEQEIADPYAEFPSNVMSPEQLAYYANGGLVKDDPFHKESLG